MFKVISTLIFLLLLSPSAYALDYENSYNHEEEYTSSKYDYGSAEEYNSQYNNEENAETYYQNGLRYLEQGYTDRAISEFKKAASRNHINAAVELYDIYGDRLNTVADYSNFRHYAKILADYGFANPCFEYAYDLLICPSGEYTESYKISKERIVPEALKYLHKGIKGGDCDSMILIGYLYTPDLGHKYSEYQPYGLVFETDYDEAMKYFKMARDSGEPEGWALWGKIHYEGIYTPKNYTIAKEWLLKAKNAGAVENWFDGLGEKINVNQMLNNI